VEQERDRRAHFVPGYAAGKAKPSTADRRRRWSLVNKAAIVAEALWRNRAVVGSDAPGRLYIPARGRAGLGTCHATATCVHDPAPGAPPDGRSGSSSVPDCGPTSRAAHGSLAARTTASATKFLLRDHALAQPLRSLEFGVKMRCADGAHVLPGHAWFWLPLAGAVGLAAAPPASAAPNASIRGPGNNADSNAAAGIFVHTLDADKFAAAVGGDGSLAYHDAGPRERILPRDSPGRMR
jgi:hypothetical protein